MSSPDEIWKRIAALKQRTAKPEPDNRRFEYGPDKPLPLVQEAEKPEIPSHPFHSSQKNNTILREPAVELNVVRGEDVPG